MDQVVADVVRAMGDKVKLLSQTGVNKAEKLQKFRNAVEMVNRSLESITDGGEPIDYVLDHHNQWGFDRGPGDNDFATWMNVAARAIMMNKEYATDSEVANLVSPRALQAAQRDQAYAKLVDQTTKSFADDNPQLAAKLGYTSPPA